MGGETSKDRYRFVAPCYDALCRVYGGQPMRRCRRGHVERVAAGDRVLVAGVGTGSEAVDLARRGAHVTAVDGSPSMLRRCAARLRAAGLEERTTLHPCDPRALEVGPTFDWVFANFFLSGFAEAEMGAMLHHLASLLRVRGHLVIGDFCAPGGSRLARTLQRLYWYAGLLPLATLARTPLHPIYDYTRYLPAAHLQVVAVELQRIAGLKVFASVLARRFSTEPTTAAKRPEPSDRPER